jgi:hypothetical protein
VPATLAWSQQDLDKQQMFTLYSLTYKARSLLHKSNSAKSYDHQSFIKVTHEYIQVASNAVTRIFKKGTAWFTSYFITTTVSVPTVEALLTSFTALSWVLGEPTYEDIALARQILNKNTMGVQSYDGGGQDGHFGIVMTTVDCIIQVPGEEFLRSDNPCPTAEIPDGANTIEANIILQENGELLQAYRLANNFDKTCVKLLLNAFDDKFMSTRADPIVRYANETTISLITHLK